jgi:hypothetical protein
MDVSGHPYDQATLSPEERALVPPVEGAEGLRAGLDILEKREISYPYWD